ncbi:MAG: hypothetical protein LBJ61_01880 [Deltaproteobacteria bacterium]|nr:hypothetical protein [Deltaproteobacteria bacterium]
MPFLLAIQVYPSGNIVRDYRAKPGLLAFAGPGRPAKARVTLGDGD